MSIWSKFPRIYKFKGKGEPCSMSTDYLRRLISEADQVRNHLTTQLDHYAPLVPAGHTSAFLSRLVESLYQHDKKFQPYIEELAERELLNP